MAIALRKVHPHLANPWTYSASGSGKLAKLMRYAFLGLVGAGVTGNQVKTHIETNRQAAQVSELSGKLAESNSSMAKLIAETEQLKHELKSKITLDQIIETAKKVLPSCVYIEGEAEILDFFTGQIEKVPTVGSGVVIKDKNGTKYILTNAHVLDKEINNSDQNTYKVKLYNGTDLEEPLEFDASILILPNGERAYSLFEEHDLALLEIPAHVQVPDDLGVEFRDLGKEDLGIGEVVIAIGNPYGQRDSMSVGFVSNNHRNFDFNDNNYFQTDAAINPGNSGGGSFDIKGRLIGINSINIGPGVGGAIRGDNVLEVLKEWGMEL